MSVTLQKSFAKVDLYGCETRLPIIRKCVVEIYSNCTDKRAFATFHLIDAATLYILGKPTPELLCVLNVLEPTRYDQISAMTDSDFKCTLNSL